MALSGSLSTSKWYSDNGVDTRHYTLYWNATQSVSGNYSDITWSVKVEGSYSAWIAERTLNVTIAGTSVYTKTARVERYPGAIADATGTLRVYHNADGSKSFSAAINVAVETSTVNCKGSTTFTLNTIARKSSLTVADGTLGTAQTLTVTRNSTNFTHTITYTCGTASGTICTNSTTTSFSFTPPLTLASQSPNSNKVTITYSITTYNAGSSLGASTYTKTCTIPNTVAPSVSFSSITDANGYYSKYGNAYVQNRSKLTISLTASGVYGSTIKSYNVTVDGRSYTSASFTTNLLTGKGTMAVTATVTDTRGITATVTQNITVLAYESPKITDMKIYRSTSAGVADSGGAYLTVSFDATILPLNTYNTAAYSIAYKKTTASSYGSTIAISKVAGKYTVADTTYTFAADTASSYDVVLYATDNFGTVSKQGVGSSISFLFSWYKKGLGWAFGKVAEIENCLDVAFKTLFRNAVVLKNNIPLKGETTSNTEIDMLHISGNNNTVLGYGGYTSNIGATNVYGNNVNFYSNGRFNFNNDIRIPNASSIYMENNAGTSRNALHMNASNALNLGYGGYVASEGTTCVYGNNVEIYSRSNVKINNMTFGANKVLWTGGYYMTSNQTATLTEKVSAQANGIVLIFSEYDPNTAKIANTGIHSFFVPKYTVSSFSACGSMYTFTYSSVLESMACKYLFISDTAIVGYDNNAANQTTSHGMKCVNNNFILRAVIGV